MFSQIYIYFINTAQTLYFYNRISIINYICHYQHIFFIYQYFYIDLYMCLLFIHCLTVLFYALSYVFVLVIFYTFYFNINFSIHLYKLILFYALYTLLKCHFIVIYYQKFDHCQYLYTLYSLFCSCFIYFYCDLKH